MAGNPESTAGMRDTLKVAMALEKELRDTIPNYAAEDPDGFNGYGEGAPGKYVCTTFVCEVLGRSGYDVSAKVKSAINIAIDWNKELGPQAPKGAITAKLTELVKNEDARTKGVVKALVDSGQGREIGITQLQPGDFVQYWYHKKGGATGGHVVQVSEIIADGVIRAHGSHSKQRGVTTIKVDLNKLDKVYCVRPRFSAHYAEIQ